MTMRVSTTIAPCLWPLARLDEAVERLGARVGHAGDGREVSAASVALDGVAASDDGALGLALERLLSPYGLDVDAETIRYGAADRLPAPLVVRVPGMEPPAFLVVARSRWGRVTALGLDRRWHSLPANACAELLRSATGADERRDAAALLDAAAVPAARRDLVAAALVDEQLADADVTVGWRVVGEPGSAFLGQLRHAGLHHQAVRLVVLHALQFALWLTSWALVGRGALDGRIDWGWMTAWVLLLATIVPLQIWTTWTQGLLALGVGRLLKERLLVGALRLEPEAIRTSGAGQLLARVLESDAVESLAIGGGLQAALAVVELVMAGAVLALGAAGGSLVVLLVVTMLGTALATVRYYRRRAVWSRVRVDMTNHLVEHLAGHRTRLAQQEPRRWHDGEDRELDAYLEHSTALDRWTPALLVAVPRAWLVVGLAVLAPAFVAGSLPAALAVALGGVLLASQALRRLADGLSQLSGAAIAWRETRPLFEAATRRPPHAVVADDVGGRSDASSAPGRVVLDVRDVAFQYPHRSTPVLAGCSLTAASGDRLLLRGRSGSGKSTFASIVAGLRQASAGLVLVDGLDRASVGAHGWRRRVVSAPQFHENHVFCETFAFNLLMGRSWPPTDRDLDDAEVVARELGLGELLERMPAGLMQLVGEGGWQLSHGERSRLFMARALLQGGEVIVLDESFAALDPETLRETLTCVMKRAPTLMVVAHP